jgi:hypothetical protein
MPYADPADKKKQMKRWRKEKMGQGYGKWLYARRKLRFENEERFRLVLEHIIHVGESNHFYDEEARTEMSYRAKEALYEAWLAEEELGNFDHESQI